MFYDKSNKTQINFKSLHCIPSVMLVQILCRLNIWNINIAIQHINLKLDWIDIKLHVKKEINHLITKKHNIPSTSNDKDTTASRTIKYPWSQTGNTILWNTINIIFDKIVLLRKNLFLLPSGSCEKKNILKKQLRC